jgi:hypothetical protein
MKTISKGPFLGLNNRLPDFALKIRDKGDFLRTAENVDINNAGRVKRRKATALLQSLTNPHSLYTTTSGARYMVLGSILYAVTLPSYTQTLVKVLSNDDAVSYVEYNGSLYWSNGTDSGRIESGINFPWGLPTPASPSVAPISGELYAGYYQVAVSYYNNVTGEEGGISPSTNYDLAAVGGLRVTLPAATTGATHINVYVSTVNGSIPMLAKTVATGTGVSDVTTQLELATLREAVQRYEAPLPAGRPFLHNGCLCTIKDESIYRGIPYRPGYHIPTESRIPFPADVSNAVSAQNGLYVVADKTYWLAGSDLKDVQMIQDVLPYGGVPGTEFKVPFSSKVGWFGEMGVVIGSTDGQAEAVMANNVDVVVPASGVSGVFGSDGYYRVVSCGYCVNLENLAASSYTDYDFTSISGDYGTAADGIYNLNATGDVSYIVGLGKEDFGTEALKHLPAVYLGADSELPMALRAVLPDGVDYTYDARSSGVETKIQRVDPGKGLRANWYDLSLIGVSDFTLASVSFAPVASTRRI